MVANGLGHAAWVSVIRGRFCATPLITLIRTEFVSHHPEKSRIIGHGAAPLVFRWSRGLVKSSRTSLTFLRSGPGLAAPSCGVSYPSTTCPRAAPHGHSSRPSGRTPFSLHPAGTGGQTRPLLNTAPMKRIEPRRAPFRTAARHLWMPGRMADKACERKDVRPISLSQRVCDRMRVLAMIAICVPRVACGARAGSKATSGARGVA